MAKSSLSESEQDMVYGLITDQSRMGVTVYLTCAHAHKWVLSNLFYDLFLLQKARHSLCLSERQLTFCIHAHKYAS